MIKTRNDQLRAARKRMASQTYLDECLSRQELAEKVNAYIWDHYQQTVELNGGYFGKLERGILTEHALVRADRLTPTERAIVHTYRAQALAKMARVPETLAAVGTADDHFATPPP